MQEKIKQEPSVRTHLRTVMSGTWIMSLTKHQNQPQGENIQPGFDDCGITGTIIKYCTRMQKSHWLQMFQCLPRTIFLSFPSSLCCVALISGLHKLKQSMCVWGWFRVWTKASAKQATNDTFIRVRDAAPEYRPRSQLLLVTELETSHRRQKRDCLLSRLIFQMTNRAACVRARSEIRGPSSSGLVEDDAPPDPARSFWQTPSWVIWSVKKTETQTVQPSTSGSPVNPRSTSVCSTAAAFPAPKNAPEPTS